MRQVSRRGLFKSLIPGQTHVLSQPEQHAAPAVERHIVPRLTGRTQEVAVHCDACEKRCGFIINVIAARAVGIAPNPDGVHREESDQSPQCEAFMSRALQKEWPA